MLDMLMYLKTCFGDNVSDEDLFYLTSKCLSENNARKLLETGFLISEFNDEELKDKIKEFIK